MTETIRVLQVLGRSAGGIARHVSQVTDELDGAELTIDIAGPPDLPGPLPKPAQALVIPDGPLGHGGAVRRLRTLLRAGDYDVVHAHGLRAGIDGARAARRFRTPVLLTVHNLVRPDVAGPIKAAVYRWAEPVAVGAADRTFAVSGDIAEHLRRRVRRAADRIEVLHLGIPEPPTPERPPDVVRAELGVANGRSLVVTAARLAPQKALPVMLEALARLPHEVVLCVLGRGPLEQELTRRARVLGLEERVRWLGFRSDAAAYIAAADVFCLSSNWEGIPLAAQEAVMLGTPIVATDVGGMPELVADGVSGRLVPKGDPVALAAALDEVLASEETARRFAAAARAHLRETFSKSAMLERLARAYREAARAR